MTIQKVHLKCTTVRERIQEFSHADSTTATKRLR